MFLASHNDPGIELTESSAQETANRSSYGYTIKCSLAITMRILISEDNVTFQTLLGRSLEKWGYKVTCTSDGEEAFSVLTGGDAPQLALFDWMMPKMDGPTLCRKLRAQESDIPLFIILLTHRDEQNDIIEGLNAGADDYVVKPVNMDELKARVNAGRRMISIQNELLEQNKLIGALQMAGTVCHEMNQPLQIISGYCELMMKNELGDRNLEMIRTIRSNIERLGDLTSRIMSLSSYKSKMYMNGRLSLIDLDNSDSSC